MHKTHSSLVDLLGIGIGPFNLSLAALLSPVKQLTSAFYDNSEAFAWHPGLLLPHSEIQINHLKDLVTLVDPTNPYSFIAYLAKHKRLYRFIHANFPNVLRTEFNAYLNWVSRSLPNLFFQETVEDITFDQSCFTLQTSKRKMHGKHLVLGSGLSKHIPAPAKSFLGKNVYHSEDFLLHANDYKHKRIAVVGGGQSSAEIIQHLLSNNDTLPAALTWITKRSQFFPLDESAFISELFTPDYTAYFQTLTPEKRAHLLQEQSLASDGISSSLIDAIYQRLYVLEFIEKQNRFFQFLPYHELTSLTAEANAYTLTLTDHHLPATRLLQADIIILCTGYQWEFPAYLTSLQNRIPLHNNRFHVLEDFSITWDGPKHHRIYVQNAARHSHGISDPNLCLMAWRSAKIINSLAEEMIYDIENESHTINWQALLPGTHEEWKHVSNA